MAAERGILGVILAGGASRRMGQDKALVNFDGEPLIQRVARRLAPQVAELSVSGGAAPGRFQALGLEAFADREGEAGLGPLAGLAAAFAVARGRGFARFVTVPCDAPFLPLDLVRRLAAAADAANADVASVAVGGALEPAFALWTLRLEADVERALYSDDRSLAALMAGLRGAEAIYESADAFLNLNTSEDLAAARARGRAVDGD